MKKASSILRNKYNHPYTLRNSVEWIQSGKNYFDQIESLIDSASFEIHLQTYIFLSDKTGMQIAQALIRAAERGVQIFILVDAYGSQSFSASTIKNFKNVGIRFRKYGMLYSHGSFHIGRRMHHKVIVIDGFISVVGGINISDHYNDMSGKPAWLDFAAIMKGDISRRHQYLCRKLWAGWQFSFKATKNLLKNPVSEVNLNGIVAIRLRRNDFMRNKFEITNSYREALRFSEKSILLVGGYFLPGRKTRRLMRNAIKRGVNINVIISEKSDVTIVNYARKYLYDWMIRNSINVFEYRPSNVHGKVLIADNNWTSIGSYDLNNLSAYSNIELNVDIMNEDFSMSLANNIQKIMKEDCTKISHDTIKKNNSPYAKLMMWAAYRIVKTLFVLSVLLAGNKEKEY